MTDWQLGRAFTQKLLKLRRFARIVDDTLVERIALLDAELTAAEMLPGHEQEDLRDWYSDDFLELGEELPTVLRYAVLTAADTALEAFLNRTCEAYAHVSKSQVRVKDLRGSGIIRAQQYLEKVANVSFPDDKTWTTVVRLHELRNCIVHAEGVIEPSRQALHKWSLSMTGLRISDGGVVSLDAGFTSAALDTYERFAAEVDMSTGKHGLWRLELSEFDPPDA
jgi:hypothetical protein